MNKILKILSILVIGFVMFSCSTPTNDPVEETPEEPTYSITFIGSSTGNVTTAILNYLNNSTNCKNLKEGATVKFCRYLYLNNDSSECTENEENYTYKFEIKYYKDNPESEIDLVTIEKESVKIKIKYTVVEERNK